MNRLWRLEMPEFFAPAPLAAVALMALNDHALKARFHNAVTGKLSDVAVCFFLPMLISGVLGLVLPARLTLARRLAIGGVTTAIVFVALELSDTAGAIFARIITTMGGPLGVHRVVLTRDLTDLVTLVMIPLGCLYALKMFDRRDRWRAIP